MRAFRVLLVVLVAVLLAGAGAYLFIRDNGLAADRRPGRVEEAVARRLVWLSIPAPQRAARNPYETDAGAWRDGGEHFQDHCAVCHGSDGRGRSEIGSKMYPPVPDLASDAVQQLSDGAIFSIIQNGVSWTGMPAFRSEHTPDETWRLVAFIRRVPTLPPAAAAADHPGEHEHGHAGDGGNDHGQAATVAIDGTRFLPDDLTIALGQTVEWVNKDPFPHNVASKAGGFRSGDLQPDQEWRFRPSKRGTFTYVCTLHPTMTAVLHVR